MSEGEKSDNDSIVVVSNDELSKTIKINQNTNFQNFLEQIEKQFPDNNNFIKKLFYYEAYSHDLNVISNEEEYVKANKNNIEYFYFCTNDFANINNNEDFINFNYLKYYSVIIFSPIKMLKTESQNIILNNQENKNSPNNSNNKNNNEFHNSLNMMISNNKVNDKKNLLNNYMINPLMNNSMNNSMINNFTSNNNMMVDKNMMKPEYINNMMNYLLTLVETNPNMFFQIMRKMNPIYLEQCIKILENNNEKKVILIKL